MASNDLCDLNLEHGEEQWTDKELNLLYTRLSPIHVFYTAVLSLSHHSTLSLSLSLPLSVPLSLALSLSLSFSPVLSLALCPSL